MKTISYKCDKCSTPHHLDTSVLRVMDIPKGWMVATINSRAEIKGSLTTLKAAELTLCPECAAPFIPKEKGGFSDDFEDLIKDLVIQVLDDRGLR